MLRKTLPYILSILLGLFCFNQEAYPTTDLPLGHWAYEALEDLAMLGMTDVIGLSTRPISRTAVARRIADMIQRIQNEELSFSILRDQIAMDKSEKLLYSLMDEFENELIRLGVDVVIREDKHKKFLLFKLIDKIDKKAVYGSFSDRNTKSVKLENERGWLLEKEINGRVQFRSWVDFGDIIGISAGPAYYGSKNEQKLTLDEMFLKLSYKNIESGAGRTSVWWGPGRRGALLISNNARPLSLVNIGSQAPFRMPYLEKLGLWNVNFFTAKLLDEENGSVSEPYLSGLRVEFAPHKRLNIGANHTVMWGGKGTDKVSFTDFLDMFFAKMGGGGDEPENHLISVTAEWAIPGMHNFLPVADGALLYCEVGAEDEAGGLPSRLAGLGGLRFIDMFLMEDLDLVLEYTRTDNVWYEHYKYTDGYAYRGNILGHHIGSDSDDFHLGLSKKISEQLKLNLRFDAERHGLTKDVTERKYEGAIDVKLNYIENMCLKAGYELEYYDSYNNTSGQTVKNHIISLGGMIEF